MEENVFDISIQEAIDTWEEIRSEQANTLLKQDKDVMIFVFDHACGNVIVFSSSEYNQQMDVVSFAYMYEKISNLFDKETVEVRTDVIFLDRLLSTDRFFIVPNNTQQGEFL